MESLRGTELAKAVRTKIAARIKALDGTPKLAVILVGDDPASHTYVHLKEKACEETGIAFEKFLYPSEVAEEDLLAKIRELNEDASVTGILVQLPLPGQDADRVIAAIDPKKDVDGFHPANVTALRAGKPAVASAVALGVLKLLDASGRDLHGKQAALICRPHFAEPLTILLKERRVFPIVMSPDDPLLAQITNGMDIVISAVGRPGFLGPEQVKDGVIVIDIGTTRVGGKLKGDADADALKEKPGFLTPVPGGVGPMTVAMLLVNILKAWQLQHTSRA